MIICNEIGKGGQNSQHMMPGSDPLIFVTTSLDGFIKQHSASSGQTKKSFFVCQSGLTAAALLNQENESFAVAGINNDIYLFSFYTGTTIK